MANRLTSVTCLLLALSVLPAQAALVVEYVTPRNPAQIILQKQLQADENLNAVIEFIQRDYVLRSTLKIVFGAEDGPAFDPQEKKILIPYDFVEEIRSRFKRDNYAKTGVPVKEAVSGALAHTLLHELVHALIALYEIPVLGKEEDAADNVATLLLIENLDYGAEIAISAADLFALEDEAGANEVEEDSFWGEHSLDAQRYYSTLCQVFGSDPEAYAEIEDIISVDRADLCVEEYELLHNSWQKLSKPFRRKLVEEPKS